jgi:hypothetical protein
MISPNRSAVNGEPCYDLLGLGSERRSLVGFAFATKEHLTSLEPEKGTLGKYWAKLVISLVSQAAARRSAMLSSCACNSTMIPLLSYASLLSPGHAQLTK